MSNVYGKFKHLNKTLQGKTLNLVKCKNKITSFRNQLELYGKIFLNKQFSQFASLENLKLQISEIQILSSHLEQLKDDIEKRFTDVFQLNAPKWIIDPFKADRFEINVNLHYRKLSLTYKMTLNSK